MSDEELPFRPPPSPPPREEMVLYAGGTVDESCVSIRFFGEDLNPDELTDLLGVMPTKSSRNGDVVRGKQYDRVLKQGSCLISHEWSEEIQLDDQIQLLLNQLTGDLVIWQRLIREYSVDVFCGIRMKMWNRGFEVSPATMKQLADRGLLLSIDVYYIEPEEEE